MTFLARLSFLFACALVLGLSLRIFALEMGAVRLIRQTTTDQIATLSGPHEPIRPASARSIRDLMTTCGTLLTTAPSLKSDAALADSVAAGCRTIAQDLLRTAPTNARARAIALLASPGAPAPADVAKARTSAPHEPWPLLIRIDAIARAQPLSRALAAAAAPDISTALDSYWGRDRIALLYVQRPDLRDTIRRSLDALPPDDQSAFLIALRREIRDAP